MELLTGFGLATAVLIDATIVRSVLLPATMRLLGDWNWWAPGPLGRLAARFGFSHVEEEEDLAAASGGPDSPSQRATATA